MNLCTNRYSCMLRCTLRLQNINAADRWLVTHPGVLEGPLVHLGGLLLKLLCGTKQSTASALVSSGQIFESNRQIRHIAAIRHVSATARRTHQ